MSAKYPRTMHLPFSPGTTSDDRLMTADDLDVLLGEEVVLTEKMDGSNVCLTRTDVYARSHAGAPAHKSFNTLKPLHSRLKNSIPSGLSVFGEWVYAVHSIEYSILPSHLMIFGVRDDDLDFWWSWDDVEDFSSSALRLPTVPVILRGAFPGKDIFEKVVTGLSGLSSIYGPTREGLVVRHTAELKDIRLEKEGRKMVGVGKWVRKNHVQTTQHWTRQPVVAQPTLNYFQKNAP